MKISNGIFISNYVYLNQHRLGGKQFSCDIIASLLSGSFCQVLTNPIWVVRVRMQADILSDFVFSMYASL